MSSRPIRVVLADDHTLVRQGIRKILEGQPGIEVVAEAADGDQALALVHAHHDVDVLIIDLKMPGREAMTDDYVGYYIDSRLRAAPEERARYCPRT